MIEFAFLLLGTMLIALAIYVEIHHRLIWEHSKKSFKPKKNPSTIEKLNQPSELAYKINVYFLWPLVAVVGATFIVMSLATIAS